MAKVKAKVQSKAKPKPKPKAKIAKKVVLKKKPAIRSPQVKSDTDYAIEQEIADELATIEDEDFDEDAEDMVVENVNEINWR